jgi:hypothetical protein
MIFPISPEDLCEDVLEQEIYPDLARTYYWSKDWNPDFYVALARAGFISISHRDPRVGTILLPELQKAYAVLDWPRLHVSTGVRRIRSSARFEAEDIELRIVDDCEAVLERVLDHHGRATSWLTEPYRELLGRLPQGDRRDFVLHGVELRSRSRDCLIAGELGYSIGRTYTSLSGFCSPQDRTWRSFGTLQLVLLAERLRDCGYAFWNLGHPSQPYKKALGARIVRRPRFLARWLVARDESPTRRLA